MSLYMIQKPSLLGVGPNFVPVSTVDMFRNDGKQLLHVKNDSGGSVTVSINDVGSIKPEDAVGFNGDVVVTVPAGSQRLIGPFPIRRFNDDYGRVAVAYSAISSVTAQILSVSKDVSNFGYDEPHVLLEDEFQLLLEEEDGQLMLEA